MLEKADAKFGESVMEENLREILSFLGEDPARPGLKDTPERFTRAMKELTSGYAQDPVQVVGRGIFQEEHTSEQVLVKDIEFYSLCEHHLLPFTGKVHVAYLPNKKVIGLSKIPRLVEVFARRLQVQERLTDQIAESLLSILGAKGVAVAIEADHFCMMMRGVQKQSSSTFTLRCLGEYKINDGLRAEFLTLVRR